MICRNIVYLLALTCALVCFSGCATVQNHDSTLRPVIQLAAMRVIQRGEDAPARAAKVAEHAEAAKTFLALNSVTLPELAAAIGERLELENLPPPDRLLADALVAAVAAELNARIGSGYLQPDQRAAVNDVLDWIIAIAEAYR